MRRGRRLIVGATSVCLVLSLAAAPAVAAPPPPVPAPSSSVPSLPPAGKGQVRSGDDVALLQSPDVQRAAVDLPVLARSSTPAAAPELVSEIVAERSATSSTWRTADGGVTVREYLTPQFYKTAAGWEPIDATLHEVSGKGVWQSGANDWRVTFGAAGAKVGMEQYEIDGARFAIAPLGVTDDRLLPKVKESTARYVDLWPGVDVVKTVSATGVKEDLLLAGPEAPVSFDFALLGAVAMPDHDGGLELAVDGSRWAGWPR